MMPNLVLKVITILACLEIRNHSFFIQALSNDITLAANWDEDYKLMDCYNCFQARGRFCIDESDKSNLGTCCKPFSYQGRCNMAFIKKTQQECSQNAQEYPTQAPTINSDILSPGLLNYQLFAFCKNTNRQVCGLPSDSSTSNNDMRMQATQISQ